MTDKIVNLSAVKEEKETAGPHWAGDAICGACHHEWHAVCPVGTENGIECPNCKRWWGSSKHAIVPRENQGIWRCNCGETLFWLTAEGALCRRCAVIVTDWV